MCRGSTVTTQSGQICHGFRAGTNFVEVMNYAMMKQFFALEKGGRMAVLMGNIKKKVSCTVCLQKLSNQAILKTLLLRRGITAFLIMSVKADHSFRLPMNM